MGNDSVFENGFGFFLFLCRWIYVCGMSLFFLTESQSKARRTSRSVWKETWLSK